MNHKSILLAALLAGSLVGQAQADTIAYTGNTSSAVVFDRPAVDLAALAAGGSGVGYDSFSFFVDQDGSYGFVSLASYDNFSLLYEGGFDPLQSLLNAKAANDDFFDNRSSGFAQDLLAGVQYVYVTTGVSVADLGSFTNLITGPGVITAVPEPESYALMLLGLGALGMARRRGRAGKA